MGSKEIIDCKEDVESRDMFHYNRDNDYCFKLVPIFNISSKWIKKIKNIKKCCFHPIRSCCSCGWVCVWGGGGCHFCQAANISAQFSKLTSKFYYFKNTFFLIVAKFKKDYLLIIDQHHFSSEGLWKNKLGTA